MLFSKQLAAIACLGFTGAGVAWADPAPPPLPTSEQLGVAYVENPYAAHDTTGSTLRLGTEVGYLHGERQGVHALGGTLAGGHRFGRLQLEAELGLAELDTTDSLDSRIGTQQKLGVIGRYDVIRLGSRTMGPNSMLAIYVEGGGSRLWTQWAQAGMGDAGRVEAQAGFGILLEHRLQEPITIPRRVGWFLGWRMGYTPEGGSMGSAVCRSTTCATAAMPTTTETERSTMFQSSMQVTW